MKFQLPSEEDFYISKKLFCGEDCLLITPRLFPKWNNENKFFRSAILREKDLFPVSLGYRKFTNYGEQPEFEPVDFNDNIYYNRKIDGSLCIISKFNNELIVRTRGTFSAESMPNAFEIPYLIDKYPKVFKSNLLGSYSILCEWTTPTNQIVIKESSEPELWLLGIVDHEDYDYLDIGLVDEFAKDWDIQRPETYKFENIEDIVKTINNSPFHEGIVAHFNDGQFLKKFKTEKYLALHKLKSGLSSLENVLDLWLQLEQPSRCKFLSYIETQFDFELVSLVEDSIDKILEAGKKAKKFILDAEQFVHSIKDLPRKEAAFKIIYKYQDIASYAFGILDGKPLNEKTFKKLVENFLKEG